MADPELFAPEIHIERHNAIITQPWTPPYKPAALPLPTTWKSVMTNSNDPSRGNNNNNTADSKRQQLMSGNFFKSAFDHEDDYFASPSASRSPNLVGGSGFKPNGQNNNKSSNPTGGFNAFAHAMKNSTPKGGGGLFGQQQNENSTMFIRRGSDSVMLGGLQSKKNHSMLLADANDDFDEYDERVGLMKANIRGRPAIGGGGANGGKSIRKSRAEREAAREEYRREKEEQHQGGGGGGGYQSGGDFDDGCIAALGDDDEYRAERLKFTNEAKFEDGTFRSPYHAAVISKSLHHHQRFGVKTPNNNSSNINNPYATSDFSNNNNNNNMSFKPSGLRTPIFDPAANMPTPVARHQRRHHHHLLRLLSSGQNNTAHQIVASVEHHQHQSSRNELLSSPIPVNMAAFSAHHPQLHASLFPPHEIPVSVLEEERRKNPFNPETWMLGDATVDDVMERHFMKGGAERGTNNKNNNNNSKTTPTPVNRR